MSDNTQSTGPVQAANGEIAKALDAEYGPEVSKAQYPHRMSLFGVPPLPLPNRFAEQGTSGTAIWGGYIQSKETNSKWVGPERYRQAAEIVVNVSVVAAGVHYFLNLISHPKWTAQVAPKQRDSHEAREVADFINDVMDDLDTPWNNIVRQSAMYRFHGFSIQEWIAKLRPDGKYGLASVEVRPQHTIEQWAVDERGTILGVFQRSPLTGQIYGLPRDKLLYVVEDALTDSPEGIGVFRHLAEPYARLKRMQELEVRGYERDLRGIPLGRAPLASINNAVKQNLLTEAEAKTLVNGITDILQLQVKNSDTGVLLDSARYTSTTAGGPNVTGEKMWDLELLSGPGQGLSEIAAAVERLQREMARIIGVEHLMLGDQGGSRAVAQDKSRNVYLIASAVLRLIVSAAQRDVINKICMLNAIDRRIWPKARAEDIAPRDALEVTTALARMAQSGAVLAPDDPAIYDVRDLLGIAHPNMRDHIILSDAIPLPLEGEDIRALPKQDEEQPNQNRDETEGSMRDEMQRLPRTSALMADPGDRSV